MRLKSIRPKPNKTGQIKRFAQGYFLDIFGGFLDNFKKTNWSLWGSNP
jgi:hypothetical protein